MRQWNFEMQNIEAECPNLFLLTLAAEGTGAHKGRIDQLVRQGKRVLNREIGSVMNISFIWFASILPLLIRLAMAIVYTRRRMCSEHRQRFEPRPLDQRYFG